MHVRARASTGTIVSTPVSAQLRGASPLQAVHMAVHALEEELRLPPLRHGVSLGAIKVETADLSRSSLVAV